MSTLPSEHKTVQARILQYAQEIGWTYMSRAEAERRRGFSPHPNPLPKRGERVCGADAQGVALFRRQLVAETQSTIEQ